ncbi:DUF397 domain-containing protein [Actinomadura sp. 1N219]|uniref:DUF397 domain-containing protein n=1 Tax=Actinomadura sp. 1N219 TaxID=3375152 RepID=UPI0037B2A7AD
MPSHATRSEYHQAPSRSRHSADLARRCADEAVVLARDSKDPDGPALGFGAEAWAAFLTTVKTGQLDRR